MRGVSHMEYPKNHCSGIAEEGHKVFGNPTSFFGQGLVAFIDLLGFAGTVLTNWGEGGDDALARLLRIKAAIPKEDNHLLPVCCDPDWKPEFAYRCKVRAMSDSVLIFTALPEHLTYGDLAFASISMIACIRGAWIQAVKEGYTVRGAIELGQLYWDGEEVTGPAFIDAYHLESRIAGCSRVILGPRYMKALVKASESVNIMTDPFTPVVFLCKNKDRFISLNPRFLVTHKEVDPEVMLEKIRGMHASCSNDKNAATKYVELLQMLENEYGIQKPQLEDLVAYSKAFNR